MLRSRYDLRNWMQVISTPKTYITVNDSFRRSSFEGVLQNGCLELKFQRFVSVQAGRARLFPLGGGYYMGWVPLWLDNHNLNWRKPPKMLFSLKINFVVRGEGRPKEVSSKLSMTFRANSKIIIPQINFLCVKLRIFCDSQWGGWV